MRTLIEAISLNAVESRVTLPLWLFVWSIPWKSNCWQMLFKDFIKYFRGERRFFPRLSSNHSVLLSNDTMRALSKELCPRVRVINAILWIGSLYLVTIHRFCEKSMANLEPDSRKCIDAVPRGAWRDRDANDIFAHCSLTFYFLDFKFSNLFVLLNFILWSGSFLKIPSGKNVQKTTQNDLAPSIFIFLSIMLKLGTPLLHTQAQNFLQLF